MAVFIQFNSLLLYILTIFKVAYVKSQCNGSPLSVTVNEMTGSFKYPPSGEYSPNLQCEWLIVAPDGQKILYKLHDVGINVGTNPCTDGISVYDGDSTSANTVETNACTTNNIYSSPIRLSSTSKVFLRFTSDGTASPGNDLGFTFLAISAAEQSSCSTTGSTVNLNATTTQQYFTSPNFPNAYPKSHTCEWIISPSDQGANVTVEFRYVDVEVKGGSSPGCYDKLIITYGDSHSETVEFCGNEDYSPNRIFDNGGSGDNITISFTSDSAQTERGFVVTYIQSDTIRTTKELSTSTSTRIMEASTTATTVEADPTSTTTTKALTSIPTTAASTITTTSEAPITTTTSAAPTTTTTTAAPTTTTTTEAPTTKATTEVPTTSWTTTETARSTATTMETKSTTTTTEVQSTIWTTETPTSTTTTEPIFIKEETKQLVGGVSAGVLAFICIVITSLCVLRRRRQNKKKDVNDPRYVSYMMPIEDKPYDSSYVQDVPSNQNQHFTTSFINDRLTYQRSGAKGDNTYITLTETEPPLQTDDREYTYIDGQNLNDDYLYLP